MSVNKNELFLRLAEIVAPSFYANGVCKDVTITNIGEIFKTPENDFMLLASESNGSVDNVKTSDFEYFSEYLKRLPTLRGTRSYDLSKIILEVLCGIERMPINGFSDEEIRKLWIDGNAKIFERGTESFNAEKLYSSDYIMRKTCCDEKCHIYDDIHTLVCDYTELDFIRPDPYHAGLICDKEISGEKLNNYEISLLMSQKIYEYISKNKCEKIQLHLRSFGDKKVLFELVEYLKRLNKPLDIFIAYETFFELDDILKLASLTDENIKISPEIVITNYDSLNVLTNRLSTLFAVYPTGQIRFGGAVTDSPTLFFEHILFNRALFSVLCEIENDQRKAYEKLRKIICR